MRHAHLETDHPHPPRLDIDPSVTNAEYKAFHDATGSRRYPSYWADGTYPADKANHPVVYVSLTDAVAYADWVSKQTGWKVTIPTSDQWEKAARGPKTYLYPMGEYAGHHLYRWSVDQ